MSFGGVMLALAGVQAIQQIGQGKTAQAEANYNASVTEGKAQMIDVSAGIAKGQDLRAMGKSLSTSMSQVAGSGIRPTGSSMAAILDAQTQMQIDMAIGQFNYQQEKNYTLSEADALRRGGQLKAQEGYTNAFSTLLKGVSTYGMYKGWGSQMTSVGTIKDPTFDKVYDPNKNYKK